MLLFYVQYSEISLMRVYEKNFEDQCTMGRVSVS